jgi:phenylacetate-CoA ligase
MNKKRLSEAIEILRREAYELELLDRRTGFHVSIEADAGVGLEQNGDLSDDTLRFLEPLGFLDEAPLEELRKRQRPFRTQLQQEARNETLKDFLAYAKREVPFYRGNSQYDISGILDTSDLPQLPSLKKSDLRDNFMRLLAECVDLPLGLANGRFNIARTSGTTDERVQVISDSNLDRVPPDYKNVWGVDFSGRTPRTAILTTPLCSATECHLGKSTMEERTKFGIVLYLNSTEDLFGASDTLIRNFAHELWLFRPEILLVNPFYLLWFGLEAQRLGIDLPPVELILTSYQFTSKGQVRALQNLFGTKVYNTYTATELSGCTAGVQCKNGNWHVCENHSVLEIVDQDTALPTKDIGSILITPAAGRVMPLIRYEVGDLARFVDIDCDCPLSNWQCFEFHGRRKDVLDFGGAVFTTKQIDDLVSEVEHVNFYRCTQVADAKLVFDFIPAPGFSVSESEIIEKIRSTLPADEIVVRRVSRLEPEPSMKFRLTAAAS